MSLLLEALKKAELAKQVAKAEAPSPEPKPEPTKPVMTREKLPDISQPLEILTDDLPSSETKAAETAAARSEFSLQEQETFEPAAQPIPSTSEFARTGERAQAQPTSGTLASGSPALRPESSSGSTGSASPRAGEMLAPIAINAPTLSIDPLVEQAYQAFQRNDLAAARDGYERALAREPTNRDALLGLAAIDVRSGQLGSAEARYLRLLEIDPRDSHAVASLISLRGQLDPVASESRLKSLIASQPEAALLHFSLGNQYAQQSRWSEAQAAYFKAHSVDPENADYAFNLAVSLDQLHQGKLALEFYRRALALTDRRAASFDPARARLRVQELSKLPSR